MQGNYTYIVTTICILLAAGLVWQELRRANKRWLFWRVLAIVVACTALACIALPVRYTHTVNSTDQHKIILLTLGFEADSISKNVQPVTFDPVVKKAYPKTQLITSDEINKTDQVNVYGYGLNDFELERLGNRSLVFHPVTTPAGLTNISYTDKLKTGERLRVQGNYHNTSAQKVKLVLRGLSTGLDSVTVAANTQSNFELGNLPKSTGRLVYTLLADTAIQGSLPVQIDPVKPLKVLILSASPDFETRFLKNWLSENGYAVASRAAISKDKFNTDFVNIPQFALDRLSVSTLNKFDVVIGDLSVLNNLSEPESAALKQEVTDNGLGVIVKADSTGKASWLQTAFPVDRPSGKEPAPASLIINGAKSGNKLSPGSAYINYRNGTQPLVTGVQNHILANSTLAGSGKIIFTTLNNTFSWMLKGDQADYTALWSALISKAARKNNDPANYVSVPALPFINEPVQLMLKNNKLSPVNMAGADVPSVQNPNIPFEWRVLYRPTTAGWQPARQNGALNWWYVYPKTDWQALQAIRKLTITKKYANEHQNNDIVTKQIQQLMRIDVPKIYFYILLLVACTFLWIETKFS